MFFCLRVKSVVYQLSIDSSGGDYGLKCVSLVMVKMVENGETIDEQRMVIFGFGKGKCAKTRIKQW